MPSSVSSINHSQHQVLLSERSGLYALDLSHLVSSKSTGEVELSLAVPNAQKILFQTADDYGVALTHDTAIGVYVISGDAAEVAQFLKMVQLLPEGNGVHDAIIIKSNITESNTGKDTQFNLFIARDSESGSVKTSLTQLSAGNGISQVVQVGTVFDDELEDVSSNTVDLLFSDIESVVLDDIVFVGVEEAFGEDTRNFTPIFTSTVIDIAEDNVGYNYAISAFDENGDALSFAASTLPAWLTLVDNGDGTATLSGTPSAGDVGAINDVVLTVSDGSNIVTQDFSIFVADAGFAGTIGNDTVIGSGGDDVIGGGTGNDSLDGGGGADTINGGSGNETIDGGTSSDVINSGDGDDVIEGGSGSDTINGGNGDDVIDGGISSDVIDGGDGDDVVEGATGSDTINGGGGRDLLRGGSNDDMINGGAGNDTIDGDGQHDSLDGGDGDDLIDGGVQSDFINGNAGRDTLTGGTDRDVFAFDMLTDSAGVNAVTITDYTVGEDLLFLNGLGVTGIGLGASELAISSDGVQTFLNHNSSDFRIVLNGAFTASDIRILTDVNSSPVWSSAGNNNLIGSAFDDVIFGNGGHDSLDGGDGNDVLVGGQNDDSLVGGNGNDTLDGGTQHDVLLGGSGDDVLDGGIQEDSLNGGAGMDTLTGGSGADIFAFSALIDSTLSASDVITDYNPDQSDIIYLDGLGITGIGGGTNELTLSDDGIQTFLDHNSSSFRITLDGVFDASELNIVDDHVQFGTRSADVLTGSADDDFISSNTGTDVITGGAGNDTIFGGVSIDTIDGGDGDDVIDGGSSNDVIDGGAGNDVLNGNAQNDIIAGSLGQDTLRGGGSDDIFVFSENMISSDDHITDFGNGSDIITLSDAVFIFASGDGAKDGVALTDDVDIFDVVSFGGGNFVGGGGATFLYDNSDGQLWYDADAGSGAGAAVLIATIDNFATYTFNASDFEGWA